MFDAVRAFRYQPGKFRQRLMLFRKQLMINLVRVNGRILKK